MNKQYVIFKIARKIVFGVVVVTALSGCGGGGGSNSISGGSGLTMCLNTCNISPFTELTLSICEAKCRAEN